MYQLLVTNCAKPYKLTILLKKNASIVRLAFVEGMLY
jgi:hypothetical protein